MYFINEDKKRLVNSVNQIQEKPITLEYAIDDIYLTFKILNKNSRKIDIADTDEFYLAISTDFLPKRVCVYSSQYTIESNAITFKVNTNTTEYVEDITQHNSTVNIEIGRKSLADESYHIILQDKIYANKRVYVIGQPHPVQVDEYYTKIQVDAEFARLTQYITSNYWDKVEVAEAIANANHLQIKVVQALPPATEGEDFTVYLVPKPPRNIQGEYMQGGGALPSAVASADGYEQYLRINGAWEHIGNTDVDLSGYVENVNPQTSGTFTHTGNVAFGEGATAEGTNNFAIGRGLIVDNRNTSTLALGRFNAPNNSDVARMTGGGTSSNSRRNIENLDWNGNLWLAGGLTTVGNISANGTINAAGITVANGITAKYADFGQNSIIEGGNYSIVGGYKNTMSGNYSIAISNQSVVTSNYAGIIGGYQHIVNGNYSACIGGYKNTVDGNYSVAVGSQNKAVGAASFVAGLKCQTNGETSFAVGSKSIANGKYSIAIGYGAVATPNYQIAIGRFNQVDTNSMIVVGGGDSSNSRVTVATLSKQGDLTIAGNLNMNNHAPNTAGGVVVLDSNSDLPTDLNKQNFYCGQVSPTPTNVSYDKGKSIYQFDCGDDWFIFPKINDIPSNSNSAVTVEIWVSVMGGMDIDEIRIPQGLQVAGDLPQMTDGMTYVFTYRHCQYIGVYGDRTKTYIHYEYCFANGV